MTVNDTALSDTEFHSRLGIQIAESQAKGCTTVHGGR
jgi:hypothetical protein